MLCRCQLFCFHFIVQPSRSLPSRRRLSGLSCNRGKFFIFVTLNFYLVIITSFIIQLTIRRWISIRFPFMCKTQQKMLKSRYVLHSKAPIITTILHNSQQRQKKVYLERIYNSHVMNSCINSWESCDYWPQATVLNGSAWLWPLLLLLPLNCLHLTIFTVWMLLSQKASKKLCLFTNSSQIAQQLVAESRRQWRSFPSYQLLLLLLKRNSCWITQFKRLYNCDLKLATLVLSFSALAVLFCACLTRCFSSAAHKDYLLPPRLCAVRLKREITNVCHFKTFQSCCSTRKKICASCNSPWEYFLNMILA